MAEIRVPTLGESVTEATVATWFKKPGDSVAIDEMVCELETDKVTVEVPSATAGTLEEIVAKEGETVGVDALLATVAEGASGDRGEGKGTSGAGGKDAGRDASGGKGRDASGGKGRDASGGKGKDASGATDEGEDAPERDGAESADADRERARAAATADTEEMPTGDADDDEPVDVTVPALGESVSEATVATWFHQVGDAVEADEMLCELETDKVSVEVPAPASGTLSEIVAESGTTVEAGAKIAVIARGAGKPRGTPKPAEDRDTAAEQARSGDEGKDVEHAPSARKILAEKGIDPETVTGTGRDGRITKEDAQKAEKTADTPAEAPKSAPAGTPAPEPEPAPVPRGPVAADDAEREERVKMTRLRQTIARRLKDAQNTAAMLTTYNEVDMTGVMDLRKEYKDLFEKKHGVKLGFMSFFTKACCHALREVPEVNAEIDGNEVVYKNYVHMGIAVGTPNGLVVPVVRNADSMGFAEIEKKINEMGARARDGKLSMADMQGGSFTISNGGVYGSLMSSPILNPPQSGILGMHKIQERPMVVAGEIRIRPMMYLALSYDHRIVDGKGAVTFLVRVKEALEDPRRLLMDL